MVHAPLLFQVDLFCLPILNLILQFVIVIFQRVNLWFETLINVVKLIFVLNSDLSDGCFELISATVFQQDVEYNPDAGSCIDWFFSCVCE